MMKKQKQTTKYIPKLFKAIFIFLSFLYIKNQNEHNNKALRYKAQFWQTELFHVPYCAMQNS